MTTKTTKAKNMAKKATKKTTPQASEAVQAQEVSQQPAPLFIGLQMEQNSQIELLPVQDAQTAQMLLDIYVETGTLTLKQGRTTIIHEPYAMSALEMLEKQVYQPKPQVANVVPSEGGADDGEAETTTTEG